MPLPWKKHKSGRISRFVSDFQQSPKHGGSLVVETGFPTSLIDLFVKNRDRLRKPSSKRKLQTQITASNTSRRRSSPPPSIHRRVLLSKLDPPSIQDEPVSRSTESIVGGGLTSDNRHVGEEEDIGGGFGHGGGGGGCVLMVVAFKVFVVAILALSTKKLALGITLSAFGLLFLEIAAARVFTLLKLCPNAQNHLDSLIRKLIRKQISSSHEKNVIFNEITESLEDSRVYKDEIQVLESITPEKLEDSRVYKEGIQDFESVSHKNSKMEDSRDFKEGNRVIESVSHKKSKPESTKQEVQTIRDVVFKNERSKSSKLKSKIVKKIVPKKLRSYKKKKEMKMKEEEEEEGLVEENEEEEEEEGSMTEVSSLVSEEKSERIESEISEKEAEECSNQYPTLLEGSYEEKRTINGSEMNAIVLFLIALVGLLIGKVLAIGLTLSWCLFLRFAVNLKSQEEISV